MAVPPGSATHATETHGWRGRSRAGIRRFRHSLRWRLVSLFLVLAVATSLTFFFGMQQVLRGGWQLYARPLVADYIDRLAAEIGTPPNVDRARALVGRLPIAIRIEGPVVNWNSHPGTSDGRREWRRRWGHDDGPPDLGAGPPPGTEPVNEHDAWWQTRVLADGHRITFGLAGPQADPRTRMVGWITLAVLLALTALAYSIVRHLLRPLDDIRRGAQRFGRGEFDTPIVPRRADELGDLATHINAMASGLHGMLDAKRALLLAISHELRSPLTRARVNAELVAEGDERDALLRDLAQMRDLITDLLESERLAAGHTALQAEACDVSALVRGVLDTGFAGRGFEVDLASDVGTPLLDTTRIRLLVRNLLDNAWRHRGGGAPPQIHLSRVGDELLIIVRDFGAGVPEDQLAQLAEPFYRPDAARQRATGGVGLGLYLCRLVAQAHGGRLAIRNAQPGLEVSAHLPWRAAG